MTQEAKHIPLRKRGGEIVAHALLDPDDYIRFGWANWTLDVSGYAIARGAAGWAKSPHVQLHRLVMGLAPWHEDRREVDHINRDKLDNRKANLRIVTRAENSQNQPIQGGTSQFRGVHYEPGRERWEARVRMRIDGRLRTVFRGYFPTEIEAAVAAERGRLAHMPFAIPDERLASLLD